MDGIYFWKGELCLIKDILPVAQVEATKFPLHISYFLQNCKKANPFRRVCPFEKTISHDFILDMKRVLYSSYQQAVLIQNRTTAAPVLIFRLRKKLMER